MDSALISVTHKICQKISLCKKHRWHLNKNKPFPLCVGLVYNLLMFTAQTQAHSVEEQEVLQNLGKALKQMRPMQRCPILPGVGK